MQRSLETTIEPGGKYIILKFNGDLVESVVESFKEDLTAATEVIAKKFKEDGKKVLILLDVTGFTGNYSLDALTALIEFAKNDKMFVEKTASFGGSDKVKIAGEIAITLSNRSNIEIFGTEKEAITWLLN